jgi:hypothetical protein
MGEQEAGRNQKVTFNDVLVIMLSIVYVWDWFQYKDLNVSRVIAVVILVIWWTLFVLKISKR